MQIDWIELIELGNKKLVDSLRADIADALNYITTDGNKFIVNDSQWFWVNPKGQVRDSVVNSAKFITSKFQSHLVRKSGWEKEKSLNGQRVDAYKEFPALVDCFWLNEKDYLPFLQQYQAVKNEPVGPIATSIYERYVRRRMAVLDKNFRGLEGCFQHSKRNEKVRVAVEFETGNVASSFRAINKLNKIYRDGLIDVGVFVTSTDKASCSARIWPSSNRNGGYEELQRRDYLSSVSVPLWKVGFRPDGFSRSAGYLGENGKTYEMQKVSEQKTTIHDRVYEEWRDATGQRRLRRVASD